MGFFDFLDMSGDAEPTAASAKRLFMKGGGNEFSWLGLGLPSQSEMEMGITQSPMTSPSDPISTLIRPTEMPTLNSGRQAKRRSAAQQLARKGRLSTILTQADDTLGPGV